VYFFACSSLTFFEMTTIQDNLIDMTTNYQNRAR